MSYCVACHQSEKDKDVEKWDIFLFFFFPVLFFSLAYYFDHSIGDLPSNISVFDFLILVLATYRFIRLFVYDSITRFIRNWLEKGNAFMRSLRHIVGCPWCAGIWFGFVTVAFYIIFPQYFIFLVLLAVSGVASLLQVLVSVVWSFRVVQQHSLLGENKKL